MIVGFMLAGIVAGLFTAACALVAGYGVLAALGLYALAGMVTMMGGAVFIFARRDSGQEDLAFGV